MKRAQDRSSLTRRQFLRWLCATAGAVAGTSLLDDLHAITPPRKPLHVIVVGAGMAGLCAAYELEKRGHTVTILEAEPSHVGGRVRTLRFKDGLYGEAGAMRIPLRHELTRHYIKEFNLPLRKFVQSNPEAYYYVRSMAVRIKNVKQLNHLFALRDEERDKTPDDLWTEVLVTRLKAFTDREKADLTSDELETPVVRSLDQQSLKQFCDAAGLSQEAIEFLAVTFGAEPLLYYALTEYLRETYLQFWSLDFDEIVGGTDRLPAAFAGRLKSKPMLDCEVLRLEQSPLHGRAAAVYKKGPESGRLRRAEGDFLLCTLPFPTLGRLEVNPSFSGSKRRCIRELNYDSATKVLIAANRRFWEEDEGIFGGGTYTDLPTGMTYYPSDNAEARDPRVSAGPGVMLGSYTWGQAARRLAALPHPERADLTIRQVSRVHPQLLQAGMVRHTASWSWDYHRWSGGAFAFFMPGQHSTLHRDVIKAEGRIFFAGEHASLAHTWMQGALESALRAVREILVAANA